MADSSKAPTKRQLKKIVKTQESVLKKEPDNLVARVKLAGALKDLGRVSEAIEHYHRVARSYQAAGRRVQALAVCRSVLDFVPDDSVSLSMIAELEESPRPQAPSQPEGGEGAGMLPEPPPPSSLEAWPPGAQAGVPVASSVDEESSSSEVVVVDEPEGELRKGDIVSPPMEMERPVREGTPNSISVVTDFGGAAARQPRRFGGAREGASSAARRSPEQGSTIGRIPIVKRPVMRKVRPPQETLKDLEPPTPESGAEDLATPSRPIPQSVIRRTLPPGGIEEAARRAVGAQGFEEEVPTVERDVASSKSEEARIPSEDTVQRSASPSDLETVRGDSEPEVQRIPTTERSVPSEPAPEEAEAGAEPIEEEAVEVVDDADPSVNVPEAPPIVEPGPVHGPPPVPRDKPLVPDSFGLQADEILTAGPLPPEEVAERETAPRSRLGTILGAQRPRRHTSPSLLDIREVLQAKSEDEIEVLTEEEEAVFAEMAEDAHRGRTQDKSSAEQPDFEPEETASEGQPAQGAEGTAQEESQPKEVQLSDVALFRDLPHDALEELRGRVLLRDLEPGDYVVREGDPGNALFVLLAGRAAVEKRQGKDVAVLTELGPGSFFGEFALLSDRKRHASVRAIEPVRVVEISRKVIGRLAKSHKEVAKVLRRFYRRRLLDTLMAATPFFTHLNEKERAALVPKLRFKRLSPGDTIIKEGSETGGFYLVLVGRVLVTKQDQDGGTRELAELGEGEYFGEMSLLKGRPAMATVVASQPTELVEVAAKDFYRVVGDHPEIWNHVDKEVRRRELANHAILSGRGEDGKPAIV